MTYLLYVICSIPSCWNHFWAGQNIKYAGGGVLIESSVPVFLHLFSTHSYITPPIALLGFDSAESSSKPSATQTNIMCGAEKTLCSVCGATIAPDELSQSCPSCSLKYHMECWKENYGCAAYGCQQVGCLKPPPLKITVAPLSGNCRTNPLSAQNEIPNWQYAVLAINAIAFIPGLFCGGVLNIILLVLTAGLLLKELQYGKTVKILVLAICVACITTITIWIL